MTTTMTRLLEPLRCKGRQKLYAGRTLRRRELSAIISWPRSAESSELREYSYCWKQLFPSLLVVISCPPATSV